MPYIRGIMGEAVVSYRDSMITKEIGYDRLSCKANKMTKLILVDNTLNIIYYSLSFCLRSLRISFCQVDIPPTPAQHPLQNFAAVFQHHLKFHLRKPT
jgi:hypothetical protein